jgi:hypothetical protein
MQTIISMHVHNTENTSTHLDMPKSCAAGTLAALALLIRCNPRATAMNALPTVHAPSPAQADRADESVQDVAAVPPWLYRSEGFAEDLDGNVNQDEGTDKLNTGLRMAAPALALCIGLAALLSLY